MAPKNRKQTNKKPKNTAFFFAKKKKTGYQGGALLNTFFIKVSPGEPKEQKSIKTRLSTTKQRRKVTLQVSKPQSQKIRTSGQSTWENGYQKNTKQLLSRWARSRQIPMGRSAKHLENTSKQSLKQCNKAADSWPTTAWKHRLGALEAGWGARSPNSYTSIPEASTLGGSRDTCCRPYRTAGAVGQGQTAPARKDPRLQKSHRSPAHSGSGH